MTRNDFTPFQQDTRAVSQTLGYVLLIAVVMFSIGAVALMGVPTVEDHQDTEYMSNTERAFEVFGNNLDAIEQDRAPSRETEIRYQGGVLFQSEDFFMEVNVTHEGETETHILAGTPVTYEKDDTAVHYEAGAVMRTDADVASMQTEPSFEFRDDRTRMSGITTTVRDDRQALSGSGKLAIIARGSGSETLTSVRGDTTDDVEVEVTVHSPRYEAWDAYFEEQGLERTNIDHAENEVTYEFETQEFMLRETLITIESKS